MKVLSIESILLQSLKNDSHGKSIEYIDIFLLHWIYADLRSLIILDTRKIFKEQNVLQQNVPACLFICCYAERL